MRPVRALLRAALAATCLLLAACPALAAAQTGWRLEQPAPPEPPPGVRSATEAIGLGHIGAISFAAPNRGVLITAGNPPTVPAGVWFYDGHTWHELSEQCGGSDGRIAWASDTGGAEEFWTISNGRPGQAEVNFKFPPIIDDTLCRFLNGKIIQSFAKPAFEADSYVPMHAAACLSPVDCWFGGGSLPEQNPEIGAFQLHWNGSTLSEEPYRGEAHAIEELQPFEGRLYESVQLLKNDPVLASVGQPPALHVFDPEQETASFVPEGKLSGETLYASGKLPWSLGYLHLSAGPHSLWAAAGERPESEEKGVQATVVRYTPESGGKWRQLLGPLTNPSGEQLFADQTVESLAAEPTDGEEAAWLALQTDEEALETSRGTPRSAVYATVAQITASGAVHDSEPLPSEPGVGPKGAAETVVCPAAEDCWLATTEGWLFHYARDGERTLPAGESSFAAAFITERPPDEGLPQTQPDTLPINDSGESGESNQVHEVKKPQSKKENELKVPVPLVGDVHTHVHGTTLEMHFHLAVKARLKLIAKRKHRIVAQTAMRTLKAGSRTLVLKLSRRHWPEELHLVEHPLAPLPEVPEVASNQESVVTSSQAFPAHLVGQALSPPALASKRP